MKRNAAIWVYVVLLVAGMLAYAASLAAAEDDQAVTIGNRGTMTFSEPMRVGDITLEPGEYRFQHRTDGAKHFVHFVPVQNRNDAGDVECKVEPLDERASETRVYSTMDGNTRRITRILVDGENVAHLF